MTAEARTHRGTVRARHQASSEVRCKKYQNRSRIWCVREGVGTRDGAGADTEVACWDRPRHPAATPRQRKEGTVSNLGEAKVPRQRQASMHKGERSPLVTCTRGRREQSPRPCRSPIRRLGVTRSGGGRDMGCPLPLSSPPHARSSSLSLSLPGTPEPCRGRAH